MPTSAAHHAALVVCALQFPYIFRQSGTCCDFLNVFSERYNPLNWLLFEQPLRAFCQPLAHFLPLC